MTLKYTFVGHKAQINSIAMPPKTSYLASAGKDGLVMMWDLVNGKFLAQTEVESPINVVLFAPQRYWVVLGTEQGIKVWDIQNREFIADIKATPLDPSQEKRTAPIGCTSLAWNKSGNLLFAGFTDNYVRVYKIVVSV
jgi:guanine nucleotide-binding protein subunit beta-2-like 1 protein